MQLEPIDIDDLCNQHGQIETVLGSLRCEPPITWGEWRRESSDFDAEVDDDDPAWHVAGYLRVHMSVTEVETDRGLLSERCFDLIAAWRPICSGTNVREALAEFVGRFELAPDGTVRRFPGTLFCAETTDSLGEAQPSFWEIIVADETGVPEVRRRSARLHWPDQTL